MELLFIWVDDYLIFKKQSFTFCGDLNFNVIHNNINEIDFINIDICKNENYINIYPDQFTGLTGIVGKNGSGKSTLLNLIKVMKGNFPVLLSRVIYCYRNEIPNTIYTRYYGGGIDGKEALTVKINTIKSEDKLNVKNAEPYKINRTLLINKQIENEGDFFEDNAFVYFSNVLDSTRENWFPKIINISTNNLLYEKNKEFLKDYKPNDRTNTSILNQENPLIDFHRDELRTQIEYISFIKKNKILNLPRLPDSITINFNNYDFDYLVNELKISALFTRESLILFNKNAIKEIQGIKNIKERFKSTTYLLSFYYALRFDTFNQGGVTTDDIFNFIEQSKDKDGKMEHIKSFTNRINSVEPTYKIMSFKQIFTNEFDLALKKTTISASEDSAYIFIFKVNDNLWNLLNQIFSIKYLGDTSFLNFSWGKLSAGEDFYLRQFSRFYSIRDSITTTNILLLIDEGDIYFHPEWQKDYLSNLFAFFNAVYVGRKLQLILTSHSPFIVSDIPRSNLIFLDADNPSVSGNKELFKETFGSNIHTLFTNSFFLNGLISSYTKKKIDSAIDYLNGKDTIDWKSDDDVQKFVRIIGEPILKNQLQKMLDSKKLNSFDKKIKNLDKRVGKIEKRK